MLKSILLSSVAVVAVVGTAVAGDLPSKASPAVPVMAKKNPFDGFYMGVHGGHGNGNSAVDYDSYTIIDTFGGSPIDGEGSYADSFDISHEGYLLGAQAGVNFVMSSGLLLGAQVSGSWSSMSGDALAFEAEPFAFVSKSSSINAIGTAEAKIGWANNDVSFYLSGGLAIANQSSSLDYAVGYPPVIIFSDRLDRDATLTGWTIGAGLDYMVSNNVSLGVSYNYIQFDTNTDQYLISDTVDFEGGAILSSAIEAKSDTDLQIVKVNMNYHF